MATNRFLGRARAVAQINTITPANVNIGNVFNVTLNGNVVSFTATAGTVANVTAGLVALLSATTLPQEFQEITWTDSTTHITATCKTAGKPFTNTSSATGGTATNVTATTTANSGPSDIAIAANWSDGVPNAADDVYVDGGSVSLLYNLDTLAAVTLTSLTIGQNFTGRIGLPEYNADSTSYREYRPQYLQVGATTVTIGAGAGSGSGRIKIDLGSVQSAVTVLNSGSGLESSLAAVILLGTHASNVLNVLGGSVGVALFGGEVSTILTTRLAKAPAGVKSSVLTLGVGCTLTTITNEGGALNLRSACTTLTQKAGTTFITGSGAITTANINAGTLTHQGTGTITTLNVFSGATADFSRDDRAITITNVIQTYRGASLLDDAYRIVYTGGVKANGCGLNEITWRLGIGRTFVPS